MNNFILINRTFCETTPESAELGDFSNQGFIEVNQKVSFTELIDLMKECNECSQYPNDGNTNVWYSTQFYNTDYRTGTDRQESIHFSNNNTANIAKYWKLAAKVAGLIS